MKHNIIFIFMLFLTPLLWSYQLDANKTYTIAFAQDTLDNDFRFAQVKMVKKALSKYPNIRFIYSDAKANSSLQVKQIEDFIYQGVDLLMTSPYDEIAATDVVAKAYRSGIPVIMVGRTIKRGDYTTYIHPDNKQIAHDAAEYLAKKMGYKGHVLLLKGVPTADPTKKRTKEFYKVIQKYPKITVVEYTANYLRREAIIGVEKLLIQGERFDAIMSQSDSMLVGARMVLKAHGIDPASLISIGIDYIKSAQDAIRLGQQDSSFVYSLSTKESVEAAIKILAGEKVPKEIIIDSIHVTKENVDIVEPIF